MIQFAIDNFEENVLKSQKIVSIKTEIRQTNLIHTHCIKWFSGLLPIVFVMNNFKVITIQNVILPQKPIKIHVFCE